MNLRQLIGAKRGPRGYKDLGNDTGRTISWQVIYRYATKPLTAFPGPVVIRGLATSLHVTEQEVIHAAATSLGLNVDSNHDTIQAYESRIQQLTEERDYWKHHATTYKHKAEVLEAVHTTPRRRIGAII